MMINIYFYTNIDTASAQELKIIINGTTLLIILECFSFLSARSNKQQSTTSIYIGKDIKLVHFCRRIAGTNSDAWAYCGATSLNCFSSFLRKTNSLI